MGASRSSNHSGKLSVRTTPDSDSSDPRQGDDGRVQLHVRAKESDLPLHLVEAHGVAEDLRRPRSESTCSREPVVLPGAKRTRVMRPVRRVKFIVRMYPPATLSTRASDVSDRASRTRARCARGESVVSGDQGVCRRTSPLTMRMVSSSVARSMRGRLGSRPEVSAKIAW